MSGLFGTVPKKRDHAWSYRSTALGPVSFSEIRFRRDWSCDYDDVGSNYYVYLPLAGRHVSGRAGTETELLGGESASVYLPESGPLESRWDAASTALCVSLNRAAVDTALHETLGGAAAERITFEDTIDTRGGYARRWAELVLWVDRRVTRSDSLLSDPLVGLPLAESLVRGFLLASSHAYVSELTAVRRPARPASVRAAVDMIEARPQDPLTLVGLAARSGVGARALQQGFRRSMGMSPMAYLREVRLRHVHHELGAAAPATVTVAAVARRWGFGHLGRFSAAYRARYGQSPHETLRGQRKANCPAGAPCPPAG